MRGAIDESSVRLARALHRAPQDVEEVLLEVGVDAPYLARALLDGDPQGVLASVSQRLDVPRPELALAVLRTIGAPTPLAASAGAAAGAARAATLGRRARAMRHLPRVLLGGALSAAALAVAMALLAASYVWWPSAFVQAFFAVAAIAAGLAAVALGYVAVRLAHLALRIRRAR